MEINERIEKIDKFLKDTFSKVIDRGVISSNMIYHELIKYGIDDRYKRVDFSKEVFPSLVDKNNQRNRKYGTNNEGYVDYEHFSGKFCVFCNDNLLKDGDPVKLYVAWEPEYVDNYVDSIIDFMVKNNMSYYLKVSKIVRNDMVTIRIGDITDAYKVIEFINNNLQRGHIKTNPFCMNKGIVGLAVDNYNSYNSRVEKLIGSYYEYKISLGERDVGYDDFVEFVSHFHYAKNNESDGNVRNNPVFLNEIKNLIYNSLTTNDIKEFENHYYNVFKNRKKKRQNYNVFGNMKNQNQEVRVDTNANNLSMETLVLFVKTTIEKHGRDFAVYGLTDYLNCGMTRGLSRITDSNGVKSRDLLNNIDRNQIVNPLKNKYGTNDVYQLAINMVDGIINQNVKDSSDKKYNKLSVFSTVAKDTYQKYGYEQTIMAISNFLNDGYMDNFTRKSTDGKISRDLLKEVDYNNIRESLMEMHLTNNLINLAKYFMDNYVVEDVKPKTK